MKPPYRDRRNRRQQKSRVETEKGFQQAIIDLARLSGWLCYHTFDSRRSAKGFPDLVMVKNGKILFIEVKTEKGKLTEHQQEWLASLEAVEKENTTILVDLWRPSQWEQIEAILKGS